MRGLASLLLIVIALLLGGRAVAAPRLPPLTGRVVDNAGILSPQAETTLAQQLSDLEGLNGRQLVVVTLPDLQGREIEDVGLALARGWRIGSADSDDGVLLIVAPKERKVRIEVGYGLEGVLTDTLCSVIIRRSMLYRFRSGDMEGGVLNGTKAIVDQLSLPDDLAATEAAKAKAGKSKIAWLRFLLVVFVPPIVSFIVYGFFPWIAETFFGRRRRRYVHDSRGAGLVDWNAGNYGGGSSGGAGDGFSGGGGSFGGGGASGSW